jgi:hypothetical protein
MAKLIQMAWLWLRSTPGEIPALLLAIGLVCVLLFGLVRLSGVTPKLNWGFGPDWQCADVPDGEPVCIKKPTSKTAETVPSSK